MIIVTYHPGRINQQRPVFCRMEDVMNKQPEITVKEIAARAGYNIVGLPCDYGTWIQVASYTLHPQS